MNIVDLVNSIIVDLDKLSVKGAENMAIVLSSIQKLNAISQSLSQVKAEAEKGAQDVQNQAE